MRGNYQPDSKGSNAVNLIVLSRMYPNEYNPLSGNFVKEQVRALKRHENVTVTVVSPVPWAPKLLWFRKRWRGYGRIAREAVRDGVRVIYPRYFALPGRLFSPFHGFFMYLSVRALIKQLIRQNGYATILHTHTILPGGLAGSLIKKEFGIPHICTIHGSDINIFPYESKIALLFTKYSLARCDHVIAVSSRIREIAQSLADGLAKISIIHNGADSEMFRPLQKEVVRQKLGLAGEKRIILYVGNILGMKGVHALVEAFTMLLKDYKKNETLLLLIGEGSERDSIERLIKASRIENKVLLLGAKPHDEIPLWLNSADVFVLPSLSEGFPLVIPEAMMCGVPVVATDVGGVAEAVINGHTGLLVRPNDPSSLANAIRLYLEDEQFTLSIIKNARRMAEKFTWSTNAEKNVLLYSTLLN